MGDNAELAGKPTGVPEPSGEQWKTVKQHPKKRKDRGSHASQAECRATAQLPDAEILRRYQRCNKCGYKPALDTTTGNPKEHKCEPGKCAQRIQAMRKELEKGKDPNNFPMGPRKFPKTAK